MKGAVGSVIRFFAITYAVSWTCFIAALAFPSLAVVRVPLLLLGTFAPSLVAIGLTALDRGKAGVRALRGRVLLWDVGARWYVFAIGYLAGIKLIVAILHRGVAGSWPRFDSGEFFILPVAIAFSTPAQAGEEIGWRGYALPRLAARIGLGGASLVLGLVWMVWHLPLFFVPGLDNYGQSFPAFVAGGVALSVAMAWLYAKTNGSLLLAMLMHSAVNQTVGVVPSAVPNASNPWAISHSLVAWLSVGVMWGLAVYFLIRMRGMDASRIADGWR